MILRAVSSSISVNVSNFRTIDESESPTIYSVLKHSHITLVSEELVLFVFFFYNICKNAKIIGCCELSMGNENDGLLSDVNASLDGVRTTSGTINLEYFLYSSFNSAIYLVSISKFYFFKGQII